MCMVGGAGISRSHSSTDVSPSRMKVRCMNFRVSAPPTLFIKFASMVMAEKEAGAHERPTVLFQQRPKLKPSVSFSGWSGLQSPGHMGLYAATSQGTYSRYGVGVKSPVGPGRPLRSSLQHNTPPIQLQQQYTQNYQNFRTRRHTMGTIYATTPLRSPPVPNVPGRRPSLERNSWPMSPTYENTAMTLSPSVCAYLINNAEAFQDPKTGIQMQERIVVNQTKRVFTGSDAIQWLVDNVEGLSSVEAAQLAGSHLLERGLIVSVSQPGQTKFIGSPNALYQFKEKETQATRPSTTNEAATATETSIPPAEGSENTKSKCLIQ